MGTDALEELGLELGGSPVVDPGDWAAGTGNAWVAPRKDFRDADRMVADQIKSEAAAIRHYNNMAKMTFGKDPVTYNLVTGLLADEVEHEEFLENLVGSKGRARGTKASRAKKTR